MSASMPRRWMKASIALLRPLALLFIVALFLRDGLGKSFIVDQIEVSADAAQSACRGSHRCLQRSVLLYDDILSDSDFSIGVGEFDCTPRRLEPARRSGRHASQGGRDLRDCTAFGKFRF